MPVTHYNKICSNPSISERKQEMIFLNNPMLSRLENGISRSALSETASYGGVAGKSIGLVVLVALSAITTWHFGYATPVTTGVTAIMAFIVACIVSFRPQTAGFLAPLYAILEGMCLACLSFMLERMIPGIAVSAVMATFGVAIAAGIVYSRGIVTVNAKFMRITMIALLGILILYAAQIILGLFGIVLPIHNGGAIGIMTITPSEAAIIAADVATKASTVELGFVDRFSGSLVVLGRLADVEASISAATDVLCDELGFAPAPLTRT